MSGLCCGGNAKWQRFHLAVKYTTITWQYLPARAFYVALVGGGIRKLLVKEPTIWTEIVRILIDPDCENFAFLRAATWITCLVSKNVDLFHLTYLEI